ncbi:hypothetical protein CMI47_00940 [Candidatus Pacearchaeota archaeon]|nr:hypothetical protein [Candidatus Pacearchaeota archaeon]|tara:strand:- start:610 stop:1239 length:630 start_codon:yes stop_codon:yes gene_type:complete
MSDKVSTVLGRVMASFRLFNDISQTDLSDALKMSQGRVSHMESGRNPPTVSQLLTFENLVRSKRKDVYTQSGFVMAVTSRVLEALESEKDAPIEPLVARECAYLVASAPGSLTRHGEVLSQLKKDLDTAQTRVEFLHRFLHIRADGRRGVVEAQMEKECEMNKSEIIKQVAAETKLPATTVSRVLESIFGTMENALISRDKVVISGFGT